MRQLLLLSALMFAAQLRAQSNPTDIIARTVKASSALAHFRASMEQKDIVRFPSGHVLSAEEKKKYATFVSRPNLPDGSIIMFDRVDGSYEVESHVRGWDVLQRVGGDAHINISMSIDTASYEFLTRYPDHITRRPPHAKDAPTLFTWFAENLTEEAKHAKSVTYLGRELAQGVLCDVIELYMPDGGSTAPFVAKQDSARNRYYIAVSDGLIRRVSTAASPKDASGRANYRETLLTVDQSFTPTDIGWERFRKAVEAKLNGKPLPKVIADKR